MCMLFAVSAADNFTANDYLKKFYAHCNVHSHGWGLARGNQCGINVEKESLRADKSHYLTELLKDEVSAKILLAHIRYATIGHIARKNCHPFYANDSRKRSWTFMHNGTIFDYSPLSQYTKIQKGDTDSERIFLYLLDKLNAAQAENHLSFDERFRLFDDLIRHMAPGNKLNLIFTDGKYLYVHTNCKDTLYFLEKDGTMIFATVPLTDEPWQHVSFCTTLAYRNGKLMAKGTPHQGEYIENPENIKLLYQIFANL